MRIFWRRGVAVAVFVLAIGAARAGDSDIWVGEVGSTESVALQLAVGDESALLADVPDGAVVAINPTGLHDISGSSYPVNVNGGYLLFGAVADAAGIPIVLDDGTIELDNTRVSAGSDFAFTLGDASVNRGGYMGLFSDESLNANERTVTYDSYALNSGTLQIAAFAEADADVNVSNSGNQQTYIQDGAHGASQVLLTSGGSGSAKLSLSQNTATTIGGGANNTYLRMTTLGTTGRSTFELANSGDSSLVLNRGALAGGGGVISISNGNPTSITVNAGAALYGNGIGLTTNNTPGMTVDINSGGYFNFGVREYGSDFSLIGGDTLATQFNFAAGAKIGLIREAKAKLHSLADQTEYDDFAQNMGTEALKATALNGAGLGLTNADDTYSILTAKKTVTFVYDGATAIDVNQTVGAGIVDWQGTNRDWARAYWLFNGVDTHKMITNKFADIADWLVSPANARDGATVNGNHATIQHLYGFGDDGIVSGDQVVSALGSYGGVSFSNLVDISVGHGRRINRALQRRDDQIRRQKRWAAASAFGSAALDDWANRFWVQGLGIWDKRDRHDGVTGYDYDAYGFAGGYDRFFGDLNLGAAFAYAKGDYEDKSALRSDTDIDSYSFMLYGSYNWASGLWANLNAGYTHGDNDYNKKTFAFVTDPATSNEVGTVGWERADFDTGNWSVGGRLGYDWAVTERFTLTPSAGLYYQYARSDSFTARYRDDGGIGENALRIGRMKRWSLEMPIELTASLHVPFACGGLSLAANVGYAYEFNDKGTKGSMNWLTGVAGTPNYKWRGGESGRHAILAGAGAKLDYKRFEFAVKYDYLGRRDFDSHQLSGTVGIRF